MRPPDDARFSLKGPQEQGASDCNCLIISTRRYVGLRIVEGCAGAPRGGRSPGPQSSNGRSVHVHPKFPSRSTQVTLMEREYSGSAAAKPHPLRLNDSLLIGIFLLQIGNEWGT